MWKIHQRHGWCWLAVGLKLKKCQFGRYFVSLLKLRFGEWFSFSTVLCQFCTTVVSKELIYKSPFTASVNWCHLLQEEITTTSLLTGSGDAGFGKRSPPNLSLRFLRLKWWQDTFQIDTSSVWAQSLLTPTMPLVNLEHKFSIVESPDPFRAGAYNL